ncbi:hypothetical protein [Massiliimalia massiliensis]|uniref:hypothetical protein n=1 Tax=Massiliimalia massiliensis TaxID=1852384 RepID=UPI00098789E5|nr:hypothetical protein [Massiliimalia massiliensis]
MIFTKTEIDVLKLSAWCKDIPVKQTNIFPAETIETLLSFKLIRPSKCGLSYRCTVFGYELLNKIGFHYSQDKYYRGKGSALTRRINNASITGFFWRYGADVFRTDPCCDSKQSVFLPSFVLRKKVSSNILGGSRLSGFLYTPEFTFIPYYIMPECAGLYADSEQRTFLSESLLCGRKAAVLYTGTGELPDIIKTICFPQSRSKKTTTDSYYHAMEKFICPVGIFPLTAEGLSQLRIMEVLEYRSKLMRCILGNHYLPPLHKQSDGRNKGNYENFLIGIDCNISRFEKAAAQERTHIILLPHQAEAVQPYLQGKNIILHTIDIHTVKQLLHIREPLFLLDQTPFQTEQGEFIYAPSI